MRLLSRLEDKQKSYAICRTYSVPVPEEAVGLRMILLRQWKIGPFFRSFSLRSTTMRLKRSKKRAQFFTCLATTPLTRQPPR